MNRIFSDLIEQGLVVYIDDLLLYSTTEEEHLALLQEVLSRLAAHGLVANYNKCVFGVSSVSFLGHILSQSGLAMDPEK